MKKKFNSIISLPTVVIIDNKSFTFLCLKFNLFLCPFAHYTSVQLHISHSISSSHSSSMNIYQNIITGLSTSLLIDYNTADINARDKRGETALHKAAFTNRADVLATLLARGVPINEQDDEGHTALHVACSFACLDAIKVLTQNSKCDLHIKNIEDESPYDVALMKDEKPVVEYLKNLVKTRPPRQSRASEPLRTNSERSAANSTRSSANSERSAASSTRSATNSERSTASNKQSANATDSDTEYCENPNGKLLGFSQFVLHAYEKLTSLSDQNIFELKPCFDLPRVADSRSREIQFYATEEAARLANTFGLFVLQESLEPQ